MEYFYIFNRLYKSVNTLLKYIDREGSLNCISIHLTNCYLYLAIACLQNMRGSLREIIYISLKQKEVRNDFLNTRWCCQLRTKAI